MPYKLDTDETVFFYEQEFYVLSNFSAFRISWEGLNFDTAEHLYHWIKFQGAEGIQPIIRRAKSAHEAFKIAQFYQEYQRKDWDSIKVDVMEQILEAKANQHEYVKKKLLETGDRSLVEDSWRDSFWGWGPDKQGQNMLGKCWMKVRTKLNV